MLVLGHRGAHRGKAPSQNSMAAFAYAVAMADGFECDACLSADGEIVLIHASDDGRGIGAYLDARSAALARLQRVDQLSSATLAALNLHYGEAIPLLRQALELVGQHPGKIINIELKAFGAVQQVLPMLQQAFADDVIKTEAVILSSFDHASLRQVRAVFPALKIGALLVEADEAGRRLFPSQPQASAVYVTLDDVVQPEAIARDLQPDLFIMPETMLTEAVLDKISGIFPNAQLGGWTVSEKQGHDQADMLRRLRGLPERKLGAMIVDDPAAFVQAWRNG